MRHLLHYWLPPIAWAAIILVASGDTFSARQTAEWLGPLNFVIRKASHVVAYGILGALFFRALRWKRAVFAVLLATAVAVLSETGQSLVDSRSGSLADVAMDFAGAALATAALKSRSR